MPKSRIFNVFAKINSHENFRIYSVLVLLVLDELKTLLNYKMSMTLISVKCYFYKIDTNRCPNFSVFGYSDQGQVHREMILVSQCFFIYQLMFFVLILYILVNTFQ